MKVEYALRVRKPDLLAVTFATTGKSLLFKNCKSDLANLEASLSQFGIQLQIYNLKKLKSITKQLNYKLFLLYNKGVGAWFWKPLIIADCMKKNKGKVIIYFDSDCIVTKDPRMIFNKLLLEPDKLYLFEQKLLIRDWTSKRCQSRMNLKNSVVLTSRMKTAGVIAAREGEKNIQNLHAWLSEMSDPLKLIDPIFFGKKHRHDQSILSLLCATGKVYYGNLGDGFYSYGPESISDCVGNSWVHTGSFYPRIKEVKKYIWFRNQLRYKFFQFFGLTYKVLVLPIQSLIYNLTRFFSLANSTYMRKKLFLNRFKHVGRS